MGHKEKKGKVTMNMHSPDFRNSECGGSSIEYAIVAGLIAIVIIGVITALGIETPDESAVTEPTTEVSEPID